MPLRKRPVPPPEPTPEPEFTDRLHQARYRLARECGLSYVEAELYADIKDSPMSVLRSLARSGCPPDLIAKILL
jgi:hypothetical protein